MLTPEVGKLIMDYVLQDDQSAAQRLEPFMLEVPSGTLYHFSDDHDTYDPQKTLATSLTYEDIFHVKNTNCEEVQRCGGAYV